jgi:glycosyltransferase involved in cell wall biosynthesis
LKRKKVTYIIADINKALAFEWVADGLVERGIDLNVILLNANESELETFLIERNVRVCTLRETNYLRLFVRLLIKLANGRPDVVHCHLRRAELVGIPVAFFLAIRKRIFTRHSSTYNHLYHPKGVWIDKIINWLSTDIIAISENVRTVLVDMEGTNESKIHLVYHGFDLHYFSNVGKSDVAALKIKHSIPDGRKMIGIIARYTWWKGYRYSLPAVAKFIKAHPEYCLLVANANGNNAKEIKALLEDCLESEDYVEIKFESNLAALYHLFDFYVHVPFDSQVEAFGQTYVEALAAGVPSIFTLSGVAAEFIVHERNALVVDFKNEMQIEEALIRLNGDEDLQKQLTRNGKDIVHMFDLPVFLDKLRAIYLG